MRVGLVAHIPDYAVTRAVENTVQRDGKLDDSQIGSQMPAVEGDD